MKSFYNKYLDKADLPASEPWIGTELGGRKHGKPLQDYADGLRSFRDANSSNLKDSELQKIDDMVKLLKEAFLLVPQGNDVQYSQGKERDRLSANFSDELHKKLKGLDPKEGKLLVPVAIVTKLKKGENFIPHAILIEIQRLPTGFQLSVVNTGWGLKRDPSVSRLTSNFMIRAIPEETMLDKTILNQFVCDMFNPKAREVEEHIQLLTGLLTGRGKGQVTTPALNRDYPVQQKGTCGTRAVSVWMKQQVNQTQSQTNEDLLEDFRNFGMKQGLAGLVALAQQARKMNAMDVAHKLETIIKLGEQELTVPPPLTRNRNIAVVGLPVVCPPQGYRLSLTDEPPD